MGHLSISRARRRKARSAAVGAKNCTSDSECPGGPLAYCGLDGKCGFLEMYSGHLPPDYNRSGLGFSAGSRNRTSTRQRAAGATRGLSVGGATGPYAWRQKGGDCPTGYTKDATNPEGCYITVADPFPSPPSRPSPGLTAGSHQAEHAAARGTRRVPPPSIPNGRYGGRRGTRYRYPGSSRSVRVGGSSLTNVGLSQCVPCSQVARAARG